MERMITCDCFMIISAEYCSREASPCSGFVPFCPPDLEAGLCIIIKSCRGVMEQQRRHIPLSHFQRGSVSTPTPTLISVSVNRWKAQNSEQTLNFLFAGLISAVDTLRVSGAPPRPPSAFFVPVTMIISRTGTFSPTWLRLFAFSGHWGGFECVSDQQAVVMMV